MNILQRNKISDRLFLTSGAGVGRGDGAEVGVGAVVLVGVTLGTVGGIVDVEQSGLFSPFVN